MNISLNYHMLIYNNYTVEMVLCRLGDENNAFGAFYMVLINEVLLINKQIFK